MDLKLIYFTLVNYKYQWNVFPDCPDILIRLTWEVVLFLNGMTILSPSGRKKAAAAETLIWFCLPSLQAIQRGNFSLQNINTYKDINMKSINLLAEPATIKSSLQNESELEYSNSSIWMKIYITKKPTYLKSECYINVSANGSRESKNILLSGCLGKLHEYMTKYFDKAVRNRKVLENILMRKWPVECMHNPV